MILWEVIEALRVKADGIYLDCTFGRGGHSSERLKLVGDKGKLIAFDRHLDAVKVGKKIADKTRILLKHENSYMAANNSYGIELSTSLSTYEDLLLKTFYPLKEKSAPCYRLDSEKHSVYSIDYDTCQQYLKYVLF